MGERKQALNEANCVVYRVSTAMSVNVYTGCGRTGTLGLKNRNQKPENSGSPKMDHPLEPSRARWPSCVHGGARVLTVRCQGIALYCST